MFIPVQWDVMDWTRNQQTEKKCSGREKQYARERGLRSARNDPENENWKSMNDFW